MMNSNWLIDVFLGGTPYSKPFRHSIFNDIFDQQTLKKIIDSIPHFNQLPDDCLEQGNYSRKSFYLYPNTLEKYFPDNSNVIWQKVYSSVHDQAEQIKHLAINSRHFAFRSFPLETENLSIGLRLVIEKLPFNMTPHVDAVAKMGVLVVYLDCEYFSGNGTTLYKKKQTDFTKVKTLDFIQNSAIAIPREEGSWHGGEWVGTGYRKSLHVYFFRHKKELAYHLRKKKPFLL